MADLPRHIGYIVDGNRRWAKRLGIPSYEGHMAGYNAIQDITFASFEAGVEYVSAYIFSTENWKRSEDEVNRLMALLLRLLTADVKLLEERNIKLKILGSRDNLDEKILKAIDVAEKRTAHFEGRTLALCLNYGGQQEIADAVKHMMKAGIDPEDVTPSEVENYLYAPEVPPLDLVVRTSGEQRLSNFMLWRAAYAEFLFLDKLWPDMTKDDVASILEEYARRGRRFGG